MRKIVVGLVCVLLPVVFLAFASPASAAIAPAEGSGVITDHYVTQVDGEDMTTDVVMTTVVSPTRIEPGEPISNTLQSTWTVSGWEPDPTCVPDDPPPVPSPLTSWGFFKVPPGGTAYEPGAEGVGVAATGTEVQDAYYGCSSQSQKATWTLSVPGSATQDLEPGCYQSNVYADTSAGLTGTKTGTVAVFGVGTDVGDCLNGPPVATDDVKRVDRNLDSAGKDPGAGDLTIYPLENDSDPDGDPLSLSGPGGPTPAGGFAVLDLDKYEYHPPSPGFVGEDEFPYTVTATGGSDEGLISLRYRVCNTEALKLKRAKVGRWNVGDATFEHTVKWCSDGDTAEVVDSDLNVADTVRSEFEDFLWSFILRWIGTSHEWGASSAGSPGGSEVTATGSFNVCFTPSGRFPELKGLSDGIAAILRDAGVPGASAAADELVGRLAGGAGAKACARSWVPSTRFQINSDGSFRWSWDADEQGYERVLAEHRGQKFWAYKTSGDSFSCEFFDVDGLWYADQCPYHPDYDPFKPEIGSASASPSSFRVGGAGASSSGRRSRKVPTGTHFGVLLDQTAILKFKIQRRKKMIGTLTRKGKEGANAIPFSGRLRMRGGKGALAPGPYRAIVQAVSGKRRSDTQRFKFRIVH